MALSVLEVLVEHGTIVQDALAASFAARYSFDRGYGPSMYRVLRKIEAPSVATPEATSSGPTPGQASG